MDTVEFAKGRWREVLSQLGIAKKFLSGANMACPACGGTDRFRFTDRAGDGDYFCNQCGAGKGVRLLMKVHGWTFAKAASEVDRVLGRRFRKVRPVRGVSVEHAECCVTPEEETAHRAAQAFFAGLPDPPALKPIPKATRDCALWLRKYRPHELETWLDRHVPEVRWWLSTQS